MYNRYIPNGNTYERVIVPEQDNDQRRSSPAHTLADTKESSRLASEKLDSDKSETKFSEKSSILQAISGLFGNQNRGNGRLGLDSLDTGDILLILIILFLLLEGNNLELVITLGLLLLMGL